MSLSDASFEFIRALARERMSVAVGEDKRYLVESRVAPIATYSGFASIDALVAKLRASPGSPLAATVAESMTTNETWFFRDHKPFETLVEVALPELVAASSRPRCIDVWSAACSTGQEPYSLAIALTEFVSKHPGWSFRVDASDVSPGAVQAARAGIYKDHEVSRGLDDPRRGRWFERHDGQWHVKPELRAMVHFFEHNLGASWSGIASYDIIFIRNVMIYFDRETSRRVVENTIRHCRPGGFLFVAGAEASMSALDDLARVRTDRTVCRPHERMPSRS